MEYHGQMALQTAILVAFTQLIPEHQVQIMGVIKARVKVGCFASAIMSHILITNTAATHGLPHLVMHNDFTRVPMPLDRHSVWLVCLLGLLTIL
jgi:hypothetical protein